MAKPRKQDRLDALPLVAKMRREFPLRLRQLRGDRSQYEFARAIGTYQQNINRYEKPRGAGGQAPHADFLVLLRMKTGAPIDWLLLGIGKPPLGTQERAKKKAAGKDAA